MCESVHLILQIVISMLMSCVINCLLDEFLLKGVSQLIDIYKDPKTDDGTKKSAKGLLMVTNINGTFELMDQVTPKEEARGCLEKVFENGKLLKNYSLMEVRNLVKSGIDREIVKNC